MGEPEAPLGFARMTVPLQVIFQYPQAFELDPALNFNLEGFEAVEKDFVFTEPRLAELKKVSFAVHAPLTRNEIPIAPGVSALSAWDV